MNRKYETTLECFICDKIEKIPKDIFDIENADGWYLNRTLAWNNYHSVKMDVCKECFEKGFVKEEKQIVRRFLKKGFPVLFGWIKTTT